MSHQSRILMYRSLLSVIALIAALSTNKPASAQQAFFMGMGDLPGGIFRSEATDISADGTIVVGRSITGPNVGDFEGFRWTRDTGMVSLGSSPVGFTTLKISDDRTTIIAGYGYRWTQSSGIEAVPPLPGFGNWSPQGVSADGGTIVGFASRFSGPSTNRHGVRWTAAGVEDLSSAIGINDFLVTAISADGLTLAGIDYDKEAGFIWTQAAGLQYLTPTAPPHHSWYPTAFSADGSKVVGSWPGSYGSFIWSAQTGVVELQRSLGGTYPGAAFDVSADGSVIVGRESPTGTSSAWIWDSAHGSRDLKQVLISDYGLGASLAGWTSLNLLDVAISADGRTIIGAGNSPRGTEAFIAYLGTPVPEPSTFLLAVMALVPVTRQRQVAGKRARVRFNGAAIGNQCQESLRQALCAEIGLQNIHD